MRQLYLSPRFFLAAGSLAVLYIVAYLFTAMYPLVNVLLYILIAGTLADIIVLFRIKGLKGHRFTPEKLSNGDENEIRIYLEGFYPFICDLRVIDEIPFQFQRRDMDFRLSLAPRETQIIKYNLRPVKRGEYSFGAVNVFALTKLGLACRKYRFSQDKMVPVYPSYLQMRKYELLAISNNLTEMGIKKIRKIGHNMEFEQIKEYVPGDDYRTINWKATARKAQLMVNSYQDEKSQQVYSLIDKGRVMQLPFEGLSLLDYAINACLVISNIATKKGDKAGLITFQHRVGTMVPASRRNNQMYHIQEALYNQKTAYRETDFSRLYSQVKGHVRQRSLLLLFTNFESMASMERQLPYLLHLSRNHLLVTIFFENTELDELIKGKADNLRQVYHKAVAEKFAYEKKLIVKALAPYGIHALLTRPEDLTVNTINKYLELKARGLI
ncbi:MAG: DUF58 domain-containing protein [Cyclobacteriaceae bacterium]|nr:DUF58 domain-containing protein [Cyclobacteriaceae bacterium]